MRRIFWTEQARSDLAVIRAFITQDSPHYASVVVSQLIATVPVGDAPGWSETAQDGRVCLVANTRSDDLSIISISGRAEIVRLPIGNGPKHITVARIPGSVIAAFKARP